MMPAHHAGEAAVIESILRAGHRVQVDKNLETGTLGPVERPVQILDAARMTGHIPEDKIRHRNTHQIAAMCGNVPKISFSDIRVAMPRQQSLQLSRLRSPMQPDLVRLAAGGKNPRLHPPLQHQPIAEVHPINSFANTQRARCHTCHANRSMLRRNERPAPDSHAQTRGCNQR